MFDENVLLIEEEKLLNFDIELYCMPQILSLCYDFDKNDLLKVNNKVTCKGCGVKMAFNVTSKTSNLVAHITDSKRLENKHKFLKELYHEKKNERSPATKRKLPFQENNETPSKNFSQLKINTFVSPSKFNANLKNSLDQALIELIVNNSLPLSLVDK